MTPPPDPAPEPDAAGEGAMDGMHVERVLLADGRALLLFTWDDPA